MARGSAGADGKSLAATMLVAIKGADIARGKNRSGQTGKNMVREGWLRRSIRRRGR